MITKETFHAAAPWTVFKGAAADPGPILWGLFTPPQNGWHYWPPGSSGQDQRIDFLEPELDSQYESMQPAGADNLDAALAYLGRGGALAKVPDAAGSSTWRLLVVGEPVSTHDFMIEGRTEKGELLVSHHPYPSHAAAQQDLPRVKKLTRRGASWQILPIHNRCIQCLAPISDPQRVRDERCSSCAGSGRDQPPEPPTASVFDRALDWFLNGREHSQFYAADDAEIVADLAEVIGDPAVAERMWAAYQRLSSAEKGDFDKLENPERIRKWVRAQIGGPPPGASTLETARALHGKRLRIGQWDAKMVVAPYANSGEVAIEFLDVSDDRLIAPLTVNSSGSADLDEGEILVKTWSEAAVVLGPALASGYFEDTGRWVDLGGAWAAVWRIRPPSLWPAPPRAAGRRGAPLDGPAARSGSRATSTRKSSRQRGGG